MTSTTARLAARPGRRGKPAIRPRVGLVRPRPPLSARLLAEGREREAFDRATFDQAAVGLAHVSIDGRFLRVNDAFCAMLGYTRDELIGSGYQAVTPVDELPASQERVRRALLGEIEIIAAEKQYLRKDGELITVSLTSRLIPAGHGHPPMFLSVIVDITDRLRAERELERQAGLLDHAHDAIFSWDIDGSITYWNQGAVELYGLSRAEALGQDPTALLDTHQISDNGDFMNELTRVGRWEGELSHRHRDGARIEVESRIALVHAGSHDFVIEANRDITERARFKRQLQASEQRFRLMAESLPQVIFTASADGLFDYVNAGWLSFTGLSFDESLGAGWTQFIHATDRDAVVARWRASIASGEPFEAEFRLRAAGGGYRWFMAAAAAVREGERRIVSWAGFGADITERHRSLVALKESEARFRRLFDANLFGVVFWSEQGEIVQANDAFLAMLGHDRRALESGWLRALSLAHEEAVNAASAAGPYETWFEHRDGRRVPVMVAEANTPGEHGERFTIVVDLSEREAREQFEQAFLADVAHDLRNPLAATKAQAQVMRRRLKNNRLEPEATAEGLETIIANSTRMARRIEELTDVAQLRAGHALELNREPVDLVAMAENSAAIYRQATERQEIRVEASAPSLVGAWDANRIERVLDNLLSNAVKYSPAGGPIVIAIDQLGDEARLSVRDHGVGIPESDREAIFERFQRGSNVVGRMGGTGIGLAGARTIIEQHGGAIEVASELGRGSVFTARLPLAPPASGGAPARGERMG